MHVVLAVLSLSLHVNRWSIRSIRFETHVYKTISMKSLDLYSWCKRITIKNLIAFQVSFNRDTPIGKYTLPNVQLTMPYQLIPIIS